MPSLAERIQLAIDAAGLDQSKVARHFDISASAVNQWTKKMGGTEPAAKRLIELARLTNVRSEWLIKGTGPMREESDDDQTIFITGEIRAGRRQQINEHDNHIKAEGLPMALLAGGASSLEATRVKGDNLEPAYSDGDILYHQREIDEDWRRHIGRRCLVRLKSGDILAGKVLAGAGRSAQIIDFRGHPIATGAVMGVWRILWAKQGD